MMNFRNYSTANKIVISNNVRILDGCFYNAFSGMRNLRTVEFPAEKITNMSSMFYGCTNLTSPPACGNNVTDMSYSYKSCINISGSPVCGENVTNMYEAYYGCYNLTGTPSCGMNVRDMTNTYYNCSGLTGSPVCGENVTNMMCAYNGCTNLTGSPVCGNNVVNLAHAYRNCVNLSGAPVCGPNVTGMQYAYCNCRNLHGNAYFYSPDVHDVMYCFNGRNTSNRLNIYALNGSGTLYTLTYSASGMINSYQIYWTDDLSNNGCYYNAQCNIYIYPVDSVEDAYLKNESDLYVYPVEKQISLFNDSKTHTVKFVHKDSSLEPSVNITSSDENIATVEDANISDGNISFTVNTATTEGTATVTITVTAGDHSYTQAFDVAVYESIPECSYSVDPVSGATYGFELNDDGYYESQNKGVNSSYSICKLNVTANGVYSMYLDCINNAEGIYDYGILSIVDRDLNLNASSDSLNVFHSFSGASSDLAQTVDYGVLDAGEHYVYIKFIKDSSDYSGSDSLQFKVRFE